MRLLPVLLGLLAGAPLVGQTIVFSDEFSLLRNSSYELLGAIADTTYLLIEQENQLEIKGFDPEMKALWTRRLALEARSPLFLASAMGRDSFTLFFSHVQQGETLVEAARCDARGKVDTVFQVFRFDSRERLAKENLILSEDRSKVLVWAILPGFDFVMSCFDLQAGKPLWTHKLAGNYRLWEQDFEQIVLDNTGLSWLIFAENNRNARSETAFRFECLGKGEPSVFRVNMNGKHWTDVRFAVDNLNRHLVGAGLYSNKNTTAANGCFALTAALEGPDTASVKFEVFRPEFLASLTGKKPKKRNPSVSDLKVRELVLRRDGGLLLVAEQFRFFVRRMNPTPTTFGRVIPGDSQTDYYYDDLLLLSFNPGGTLHWKQVLYKRQVSRDDEGYYSSYFMMKTRNNLRFLYNDEIKTPTNVNEYIVNAKGEYERKSLMETGKDKLALSLRSAVQITNNVLIVPSERRNDLRLVKIIY